MSQTISSRQAFAQGALDSLPLIVAATPFGVLFGALAPATGIESWIAVALSALVFAGSAQYVAIGLLAIQTPPILVVLTTFIVNLRHLLYSLALAPEFRHVSTRKRAGMAFFLTDETFAVVSRKLQQGLQTEHRQAYYLGSALFMYGNWQLWTWVGIFLGQSMEGIEQLGLEFAMVVAFIGMMVPMIKRWPTLFSAVLAFVLAWFTREWPHRSGLIVSVLVAAVSAAVLEKLFSKSTVIQEGSQ
jgi:4-azaleucine resistance transporter AzlC